MKKSKKEKEFDLKDWNMLSVKTSVYLNPSTVMARVVKSSGTAKKGSINIAIKIGDAILKQLDWKDGDLLTAYNHKDDELRFILFKSNNGKKLSRESTGIAHMVQFRWIGKTLLQPTQYIKVEHKVHSNGMLEFRANF